MNDYIFTRSGPPAIYGQPLEAQLGSTDALRGLGSYTFLRGADEPAKKTNWVAAGAVGLLVLAWLRKR